MCGSDMPCIRDFGEVFERWAYLVLMNISRELVTNRLHVKRGFIVVEPLNVGMR